MNSNEVKPKCLYDTVTGTDKPPLNGIDIGSGEQWKGRWIENNEKVDEYPAMGSPLKDSMTWHAKSWSLF